MFKKVLLSMLLVCPSVVWGQLLSVTATLTDSDTVVWANATCSVEVYSPNGNPFFGTTPVPQGPQACAVNGSGVLSTSIYNTSTITPSGAQYRFTISSATSAAGSQFLTAVTAANQTSNLSALITAPRFNASLPYAYGYADVEALALTPGAIYYKTTTTAGSRVWSGSAWTALGGGGGGTTSCATTSNLLAGNGVAGGCVSSGIAPANVALDNTDNNFSVTQHISNSGSSMSLVGNGIFASEDFFVGGSGQIVMQPGFVNTVAFTTASTTSAVPIIIGTDSVPTIPGTPLAGQTTCLLAAGPPPTIGKCTSVVGAGGACTCTSF